MLLLLALLFSCQVAAQQPASHPNILWITSEDMGPHLGAYGDSYAVTPELDQLASRGMIYRNAWSTAPVCAPARTTLISGLYPPSTGSQHMRSNTRLPASMKMYPQYMRAAGYYCTNNSKEDYNLIKPGQVWDESSREAHWRNRKPGQPFFAIFNFTISHESRIRDQPHELKARPGRGPRPRLPSRHARSAAGLGAILRPHHRNGRAGRRRAPRAGTSRARRRNDHLLLRRPRLGHAAQQALDLQLGPECSPDRLLPREIPPPRSQRLQTRRGNRSPGGLHRFGPDPAQRSRRPASRAFPGTRFRREIRSPRAALHLRFPRAHGRALRHGPDCPRQALHLHPQLQAA